MDEMGLYVHIPFCQKKCDYCDFATFAGAENRIDDYIKALGEEAQIVGPAKIKTLFIGGGTPSVLNPLQIHTLFENLRSIFDFSILSEATVEMNPESATDEIIQAYKEEGINRVSLGLQSSDISDLKWLGRLHQLSEFERAVNGLTKAGLSNWNVDLMFGWPGHTMDGWERTLAYVQSFNPSHISTYALKIEKGTPLAGRRVNVDDDLEADLFLQASKFLTGSGYVHYEISNFAKPGKECRHNLVYWKNEPFVGLGLSAAGFKNGLRQVNAKTFDQYFSGIREGRRPVTEETRLGTPEYERENLMLGLRLREGVMKKDLDRLALPNVRKFLDQGLAFEEKGWYRLTPEGWLVSNQLFQEFV